MLFSYIGIAKGLGGTIYKELIIFFKKRLNKKFLAVDKSTKNAGSGESAFYF
jgi:hypothetical protein